MSWVVRLFDSPDDLRAVCSTIVAFELSALIDHFAAVLDTKDNRFLIADPLYGLKSLSRLEFARR